MSKYPKLRTVIAIYLGGFVAFITLALAIDFIWR